MDRHQSEAGIAESSEELDRAWREHRRHLLDIGFRMLANLGDAEDAVQETYARLARADINEIDDVGGWLVVVVSRVCLDKLRAKRRHPTEHEASLVEKLSDPAPDPADRVTLDDNVRLALVLVLERLTPAERTAFVLHDVFQYSFDAISEIVGRTPAACRQLASRARRTISASAAPSRFHIESAEQRRVVEQFIAASTSGDLDGLLAVLDPAVSGKGDVGAPPQSGRAAVAKGILHYLGPHVAPTLLPLPAGGDDIRIVVLHRSRVATLLTLTVRDGRIHHVDAVSNPITLRPIAEALGHSG